MPKSESIRPLRYSRRRAATLAGVYLLMTLHIVHWKLADRTLAPLELNEVMYTLELGVVTAGFVFMMLAALATCLFGRFFCSWGCHILALEDLSLWLLEKAGIHPKPVRSRVLRLVPIGALFYMFVWPQIGRLLAGRAFPQIKIWNDTNGWASFLTADFARNLPGPGIALLTFLLCGFAIIYMLGSRSFCTYGCPYGVVFGLADRLAPGRIIATGDCKQCGKCTAVCQSHVRVHEEAARFGNIVNPACLKDLDCVSVCPNGALRYGLTRPSLLQRIRRADRPRLPYDFSLGEDALMVAVFIASLLIYRGLYGVVPFLMTLAVGGIMAYLAVLAVRLIRQADVRLNNYQLKRGGRLRTAGWSFVVAMLAVTLFSLHSGFIRYHEFFGDRAYAAARAVSFSGDHGVIDAAIWHHQATERFGLYQPARRSAQLAALHAGRGESLANRGQLIEAMQAFQQSLRTRPNVGSVRYNLAVVLSHLGHEEDAMAEYQRALSLEPRDADSHHNLAVLLARRGQFDEAAAHLRAAIAQRSGFASAHYGLALLLESRGHKDEAAREFAISEKLGHKPAVPP